MTPIVLDTVKPEVIDKLNKLAQKHDRTIEAEITAILENATANIPISTPPNRGWSEGFFEEVIGSWAGEPLVREPQSEYQERDSLLSSTSIELWEDEKFFVKSLNQPVVRQERSWKRGKLYDRQNFD